MASGRRDLAAADAYISPRQGWTPPGIRRHAEISNRSLLAGSHSVSRVFSRRQRRGHWRQPPDRLDGIGGEAYPTVRGISYSGAGQLDIRTPSDGFIRKASPSNVSIGVHCWPRLDSGYKHSGITGFKSSQILLST